MTLEALWRLVWALVVGIITLTAFVSRMLYQHRKMYRLLYGATDQENTGLVRKFESDHKLLEIMVRTGAESDPHLRKSAQKLYPKLLDTGGGE